MRIHVIFFCAIIIVSCSKRKNKGLTPLLIAYADDVPRLMVKHEIRSAFEIITNGNISRLNVDDTLNYYRLNLNKSVNQKLRSFMCCSYDYEFDSLGILKQKREFTDYTEYFTFERERKIDTIFENMRSNFGWSIDYEYLLKNEKIISKIGEINKESYQKGVVFYDVTNYNYNEEGLLTKKNQTQLNYPGSDFSYRKTEQSYVWDDDVLKHVSILYFYNDKDIEPNYIINIKYDSIGFPFMKTMIQKKDTLYQTFIIKK
ncbi:hypothetical protein A9Q86_09210 [Flavobacteriales bacterium 33_180_T64]|nr:hypothetical protein A9Q86_09210 [Flavobacteriales bacterium 33_180_T64]